MTAPSPSCHRPGSQKQRQKQKQNSRRARLVAFRRLKGWRPRLPSELIETQQKRHPDRSQWRLSRVPGPLRYSTMTIPTAAQADHF